MIGILRMQSGQPEWLVAALPAALRSLDVNNRSPNLVPGVKYSQIILGTPHRYFDPQAYSAPGPRQLGNVGRNTIIGPGLATWDSGLFKDTSVTERVHLQFRAEFFNLLNRANFGVSQANSLFDANGGRIGSAGVITNTVSTSRQVQFGLSWYSNRADEANITEP
jgi:hypothetical protein